MISSTSFRNRTGSPKFGPGLLFALYLLSVSFAFGIGYRLGGVSQPAVAIRSTPHPAAGSSTAASPSRSRSTGESTFPSPPQTPASTDQSRMVWASIQKPKYTLYLASFEKFSDAEKEKTRLESKGLKGVEITEKRMPAMGGNLWYRLSYGRFDNAESAAVYGRQLTERGLIRDFWTKEVL